VSVSVIVALREDINVAASGIIGATASGFIYLGSEVAMNLGRIEAGAASPIRLKGGRSITDGTPSMPNPNIIGGALILEAAAGSIGSATKPVRTDLAAGATLTARAGGDSTSRSCRRHPGRRGLRRGPCVARDQLRLDPRSLRR